MVGTLNDSSFKCFYLAKYFCGTKLAQLRPEWTHLRDNLSPSAELPTKFYARCLKALDSLNPSANFPFTSKACYVELIKLKFSSPILPGYWTSFVGSNFSLLEHWSRVRDPFSENIKNDLSWLISLRAVKVRYSLRNWGYINYDICGSCPRRETIDHCFLNCRRVKLVWAHFLPLLSLLISTFFVVNCVSVFLFEFTATDNRSHRLILHFIKSILFGIWKFRNKATFHNGKEDERASIKYICFDVKSRIRIDRFRFSRDKFCSLWCTRWFAIFFQTIS